MKIYLCRHGQTTGDIEDRYGGDYNDHLTNLGKTQAKQLANKLLNKGIEIIYVSPKIRAQETAQIINTNLKLTLETINDLRERNQNGILTGKKRSYCQKKYPDLVEKVKNYKNTIDGAENYESFSKRVLTSLNNIAKSNKSVVAIVTHGGPIRVILRHISYLPDYKIEDCGYAELETDTKKYRLISLNGITPVK